MAAVFFGALLFLRGILANPKCSVSVYQNNSVAYIISEPSRPGCTREWTSADTMLVDMKGNFFHEVILHVEPQRIVTVNCQHNITYHEECLAQKVSMEIPCDYKCPVSVAATAAKHPHRSHVVPVAVIFTVVLLICLLLVIKCMRTRHTQSRCAAGMSKGVVHSNL